ncbi:RNA-binding protein [Operophtera brumata]|uniref:RNA-binding protein n=1 Tax=Operophtera brumata TaxID=104452 RepID=A0A0L7L4X9_OPEBR|nr:RNA-binding protein [Operophtera brumata]
MMLDCGKIKEIQVKLLLSSRSEMHKVIEAARQTVPLLLAPAPPVISTPPAPIPTPTPPVQKPAPLPPISPFTTALGNSLLSNFGIPGLGNPIEIPQPAVIAPPAPLISPSEIPKDEDEKKDEEFEKRRKDKERRRSRSRTRSRDRDRKDRKRDRRDRSRSKERRRRDRSRSRERRGKRDRNNRSRSRDRSPSLRSRNRRGKSPSIVNSQEKDSPNRDVIKPFMNPFANPANLNVPLSQMLASNVLQNVPVVPPPNPPINRFNDPSMLETLNKMQELAKKRNPNAFQNRMENEREQNGGKGPGRGGMSHGGGNFRGREGRMSRFEDQQNNCCVAVRNAPNHTSYGDVRRFFPFLIDKHGIKMINDNMGRRTGNIFVRFCEMRSKQLTLQRKNNELKGAQVIVEDLDDESYDAAVDSFLPFRDDNDEDDRNMVIHIPEPELPKPIFTVLKLADLPNYIKEHDIIKTFGNFSLLAITLSDDRLTRSRIAYVQFAKHEDAREAFERKERIVFGRRQPTITIVTDEEYNNEVKNSQNSAFDKPEPREEHPEMQEEIEPPIREPETAGPRDPRQRRQFDSGSNQNGPQNMQGQTATAPFFVPPFVQQGAFPSTFGGQFPSGFPVPGGMDPRTAATNWANRPPFPSQVDNMGGGNNQRDDSVINIEDEPLDCVLMKGLPRDASDRTIVSFLSDVGAVPARIHLMLDTKGLPSGDCFCEFRSPKEARMAVAKHGHNLEGYRVTIDLVPRGVVEEALDGPKQMEIEGSSRPPPSEVPPQFFDRVRGGGGFNNSRGSFRGRGGFNERGSFNRGFDRGGYRGRGFDRGGPPRGGFDSRGRGRGGPSRGRGGFENGGSRDEPDPALEDFGAPGCVVGVENVPFRATIDEILQFFSEFELTQDDVIRRYNEFGQPTGDARVAFRTPFDAQRAVKTRHMDTIQQRRISLSII